MAFHDARHHELDGREHPGHVVEASTTSTVLAFDLISSSSPPNTHPSPPLSAATRPSTSASHPFAYYPPASSSQSAQHSHESPLFQPGGLPEFSRWSPTWVSGSLSGDGRAVTYHAPPTTVAHGHGHEMNWQTERRVPAYDDDFGDYHHVEQPETNWVEEHAGPGGGGRWKAAQAMGTGQHGVGYAPSSPTSRESKKVATRLAALQAEFGAVGTDGSRNGFTAFPASKAEAKTREQERVRSLFAKEKEKREREAELARSGLDGRGRLLSPGGTRKRAALRWGEALGAVVVGFCSIGAALLTRPTDTPPPRGSLAVIALYILPFPSLFLSIYFSLWRPRRARALLKGSAGPVADPLGLSGMQGMTLFVGGSEMEKGKGCCCCLGSSSAPKGPAGGQMMPGQQGAPPGFSFGGAGKRGRKSHVAQQPVAVNLMIDPRALMAPQNAPETKDDKERRRRRRKRRRRAEADRRKSKRADESSEDEEKRLGGRRGRKHKGEWDSASSSSSSATDEDLDSSSDEHDATAGTPSKLSPHRLLALHALARRTLLLTLVADSILCAVWLLLSLYAIGFTAHCRPGSSQGWCDFYNTAVAGAVMLGTAFGLSAVLGGLDRRRTRHEPSRVREVTR